MSQNYDIVTLCRNHVSINAKNPKAAEPGVSFASPKNGKEWIDEPGRKNHKTRLTELQKMRTARTEKWIVSDPGIMMGKAVVSGTRITVELIMDKLRFGETIEDLINAHPRLTREAIQAAIAFALVKF